MSTSSLSSKTIRPGSLNGYSYYYSNRRPATTPAVAKTRTLSKGLSKTLLIFVVVAVVAGMAYRSEASKTSNPPVPNKQSVANKQPPAAPPAKAAAVTPAVPTPETSNKCAGNTEPKLVKISVERRHLWACEGSKTVHSSPIITGLRGDAETETPVGTYKIYAKQADTRLTGTDSRGSWNYPVNYWLPFLDNQYGTYGFHDATWRASDAFGNVSPDSQDASHGCIELPLNSSKWLYDWAAVHTVVAVEA